MAVYDWQRRVSLEALGYRLTKVFMIDDGDHSTVVRTRKQVDEFIREEFTKVYGTDGKELEVAE